MKQLKNCLHLFLPVLLHLQWCLCSSTGVELPSVTLVILASNEAHILPHYLGAIDRMDYPKERITLWIRSDHNDDSTALILEDWLRAVSHQYQHVDSILYTDYTVYSVKGSPEHWIHKINLKQKALEFSRHMQSDYIMFIDCSVLLVEVGILQILQDDFKQTGALVLSPYIEIYNNLYTNYWTLMSEDGYFIDSELQRQISEWSTVGCFDAALVRKAFVIDNNHQSAPGLEFLYQEMTWRNHVVDTVPFSKCVTDLGAKLMVCNRKRYGETILPHELRGDETLTQADAYNAILRRLALSGIPMPPSKYLHATKAISGLSQMFDHIYIINLQRRPQRRLYMRQIMWEAGVDNFTFFEAVDGKQLNQTYLGSLGVQMMDGFVEPSTGRTHLTNGEIGCFLSHYFIWQDAAAKGYRSVLVLEDDATLDSKVWKTNNESMMKEFHSLGDQWDVLYLGRKVMDANEELSIPGLNYISKPGYSYWCVAYALSARGINKLLSQRPLEKMIPTDEFIPIMYDRHPREDWKRNYSPRDLVAYSTHPLLFWPSHYPDDMNYISDTEEKDNIDMTPLPDNVPTVELHSDKDEL